MMNSLVSPDSLLIFKNNFTTCNIKLISIPILLRHLRYDGYCGKQTLELEERFN